jgi:DNA-binding winged helix-turn-helix (wHTH) protein/Tol biopolymer transport system component
VAAPGFTDKTDRIFRFGPFELFEREGELRRNGVRIKLQEQPFRVLIELVANAGKVVGREDLQQKLWPADTFVDFDVGLNTAIRKLRQALNDDADNPHYIETLAKRGYRFIGSVDAGSGVPDVPAPAPAMTAAQAPAAEPVAQMKPVGESDLTALAVTALVDAVVESSQAAPSLHWKRVALAAVAAAVATVSLVLWMRPPAAPVVETITPLTDDEKGKIYLQTDGERVYFNEDRQGSLDIGEVSVKGGAVAVIPTNVLSPAIVSVAPDASSLLVLQGSMPVPRAVWEVPLPAGEPQRMGDLEAHDASFTPDGRLLLCRVADLVLAEKDGSNPRTILTLKNGHFGGAEMSPDGRRIVFTRYGEPDLYVVNSDGSGMKFLARNPDPGGFCCARWTPDGRYIVFSTRFPAPRQDLWYLRMKQDWLQSAGQPKRLTAGPLSYWMPVPSRDGKAVFAIGTKRRSELFRYDLASKGFVPFLSGLSASDPTFSRDGEWIAYRAADGSLWRSHSDGSDRLQLTFPPAKAWNSAISPDGKWVSYGTGESVFIMSMDGGVPKKVFDHPAGPASWSPDGNLLVFNDGGTSWQTPDIHVVDLRTGQVSPVPGGQLTPQWAGPGTIIAARRDMMVLQSYDVASQRWSDLSKPEDGPVGNWSPSPDFSYFYYTTRGQDPRIFRVRMADMKTEVVASLKDVHLAPGSLGYTQMSVAQDGSPVLTYEVGTQEVYALSVKWP